MDLHLRNLDPELIAILEGQARAGGVATEQWIAEVLTRAASAGVQPAGKDTSVMIEAPEPQLTKGPALSAPSAPGVTIDLDAPLTISVDPEPPVRPARPTDERILGAARAARELRGSTTDTFEARGAVARRLSLTELAAPFSSGSAPLPGQTAPEASVTPSEPEKGDGGTAAPARVETARPTVERLSVVALASQRKADQARTAVEADDAPSKAVEQTVPASPERSRRFAAPPRPAVLAKAKLVALRAGVQAPPASVPTRSVQEPELAVMGASRAASASAAIADPLPLAVEPIAATPAPAPAQLVSPEPLSSSIPRPAPVPTAAGAAPETQGQVASGRIDLIRLAESVRTPAAPGSRLDQP